MPTIADLLIDETVIDLIRREYIKPKVKRKRKAKAKKKNAHKS